MKKRWDVAGGKCEFSELQINLSVSLRPSKHALIKLFTWSEKKNFEDFMTMCPQRLLDWLMTTHRRMVPAHEILYQFQTKATSTLSLFPLLRLVFFFYTSHIWGISEFLKIGRECAWKPRKASQSRLSLEGSQTQEWKCCSIEAVPQHVLIMCGSCKIKEKIIR